MENWVLLFACLVFFCFSACAIDILNDEDGQNYQESRSLSLDSRQIDLLRIKAGAGVLQITGGNSTSEIVITAQAYAASAEQLKEVRLLTSREETTASIVADLAGAGNNSKLDLHIVIPDSINLDIDDSSGDVTIENLRGNAYLRDGSGNIVTDKITGQLRITDGSGNINVQNTVGEVIIDDDASGNIEILNTVGNVTIAEDGSGDVSVGNVEGDFVFKRDGSGNVNLWNISGIVQLP